MYMNEWLFLLTIALYFSMMLFCYKLFGRIGLFLWICLGIVAANIEVMKMVNLFGLNVTLGNVVYASTFLATDILTEKYGPQTAKHSVKMGFYTLASFVVITQLALRFVPAGNDFAHPALASIFSLTPRLCLASIVTYYTAQTLDIMLYCAIKQKTGGKYLWLRNNAATAVAQLLDTGIYTLLAFWGVFEFAVVLELVVTSYIIKLVISLLDTPFLYIARKMQVKEI